MIPQQLQVTEEADGVVATALIPLVSIEGSVTSIFPGENDRLTQDPDLIMKVASTDSSLIMENDSNYDSDSSLLDHCHTSDEMSKTAGISQANKSAMKRLAMACVLVALFIASEVVGGYISGSLAIMGDAAHMMSDLASFVVSLVAIWIGSRNPKKGFNFGYARAEVLGALLTVVIIWYVTGVLVYLAIHRIQTKEFEVEGNIMIIVAALAVGFNILLGLLLHGVCHVPHSHGHSHGHAHLESHDTSDEETEEHQMAQLDPTKHHHLNVRAALIHVLGDLLQSIGVLISSIVIKTNPEYKLADPICTLIFAAIVFMTTITILRDTLNILMEGSPHGMSYKSLRRELLKIRGVSNIHDLKVWSLSMDKTASMVHVVIRDENQRILVLQEATRVLKLKFKINFTTIQIDDHNQFALERCKTCNEQLVD